MLVNEHSFMIMNEPLHQKWWYCQEIYPSE